MAYPTSSLRSTYQFITSLFRNLLCGNDELRQHNQHDKRLYKQPKESRSNKRIKSNHAYKNENKDIVNGNISYSRSYRNLYSPPPSPRMNSLTTLRLTVLDLSPGASHVSPTSATPALQRSSVTSSKSSKSIDSASIDSTSTATSGKNDNVTTNTATRDNARMMDAYTPNKCAGYVLCHPTDPFSIRRCSKPTEISRTPLVNEDLKKAEKLIRGKYSCERAKFCRAHWCAQCKKAVAMSMGAGEVEVQGHDSVVDVEMECCKT